MATVKKILYAAITIAILILFIFIILSLFKKGDSDVNKGSEKYTEIAKDIMEADKSYYDGKVLSGQEVIEAIKRFKDEEYFTIAVTNGKGNTGCFIKVSSIVSGEVTFSETAPLELSGTQSSKSHPNYINPDAKFKGKVYKDKNDVIVRIDFTQE